MLNFLKDLYQNFRYFVTTPEGRFLFTLIFVVTIPLMRLLFLLLPNFKLLVYCLGIILFVFLWDQKEKVIGSLLNSYIFQQLFLFSLSQENILYGTKGRKGFFLIFIYFFALFHCPPVWLYILKFNPFIWYWFILLFFLIYLKLRDLFIYPNKDLIAEIYTVDSRPILQEPTDYNWNFVVKNIDLMAQKWVHTSVSNRINPKVSAFPLTNVGVRYIVTSSLSEGVSKGLSTFTKENPKMAFGMAAAATAGTVVAVTAELALKNQENNIRREELHARIHMHKDQLANEIEIKRMELESQERIAQIQAKVNADSTQSWWSSFLGKFKPSTSNQSFEESKKLMESVAVSNPIVPNNIGEAEVHAKSLKAGSSCLPTIVEKFSTFIDYLFKLF